MSGMWVVGCLACGWLGGVQVPGNFQCCSTLYRIDCDVVLATGL